MQKCPSTASVLSSSPAPETPTRVILVFIDGLGMAERTAGVNPLSGFEPQVLRVWPGAAHLPRGGRLIETDSCLGVSGLPQSATGQTALLTGVNAPFVLGRHLSAFPNRRLREIIARESIFARLLRQGLRVTFANTYTPEFFERRPRRLSVSSCMCLSAGVRLWRLPNLLAGESLFADFTNRMLWNRGYKEAPLRSPAQAAEILLRLSARYDFCFYEYFLTDLVGHRGSYGEAVELLSELDEFLAGLVAGLDLETTSLMVASDHGNIEAMDRKQHTANPVPTLLWGRLAQEAQGRAAGFSLLDVTPLIEDHLADKNSSAPQAEGVFPDWPVSEPE